MTTYAVAHAHNASRQDLVDSCARQLGHIHRHTLGFVYATHHLGAALNDIVANLKAQTLVEHWVGTVGSGVCTTRAAFFDRPALVVLTCDLDQNSFRLLPLIRHPNDVSTATDDQFFGGIAIVHADPRNRQASQIISSLAHAHAAYLVGGVTAAEHDFPQVAGGVVGGGVSGVLLDETTVAAVGLSQGCTPIGPVHTVERGSDNILITLDGESALDILCEDLGIAQGADPRRWLKNIHAALPVTGTDTDDYLVRNLIGIEPSNGLVVIADRIAPGDRVMFVRRDAHSAAEDLHRMLTRLAERINRPPKAGLYFSCVARGPNLFENGSHELDAIHNVLGAFPIAGFFGNGEISNDRVYGYTGVLTLFL